MLISKLIVHHHRKKTTKNIKQQLRITDEMRSDVNWMPIVMCAERLLDYHRKISSGIENRLELLKNHDLKLVEADRAFIEEVNSFAQDWHHFGNKLTLFILNPSNQDVIWVEGDIRALPNSVGLFAEPENPGLMLSERFFNNKKSVVMTSATLSVNHSFDFYVNELGLTGYPLIEKLIGSPFQYDKMAKLMIPTDLPEIRSASNDEYIEAISGHLIALAEATDGRMLVLFTSYDMLRKTYNLIKDTGALDDFVMLAQGVTAGSRSRLTKSFQQFNKAILFGTSSFWEGVDIPGKKLSCLVIVRLPFSPPDEPTTAAKYEEIKSNGKNPFLRNTPYLKQSYALKQGFGRLIRSETDRGVVIVLDRRIDTTSYGKAFLESIPDVPLVRGPLKNIISTIEKWL